jgi:glyoxylase-like metal-dependent hydrolase (beta-lactamase superfamily II)
MDAERLECQQPLYGTVNVYRIEDTLVDTGHVAPVSRERVAEALDGGPLAGVERVVLTHPHIDHVGGSQTIPALADLPHVVPAGVPAILHGFDGYLERARGEMRERGAGLPGDFGAVEDAYFPRGEYAADTIEIERVVGDGDTVRLGGEACEALHTPGHSAQHLAFWHADSGTLFSADLVSTNGHFMYGPLHGDVGAYLDSLERLRGYDADRLVPGHGPVMTDPTARIDDAIEKAESSLAGIERAVAAADEPVPARRLARDVFGATDATVGFLTFVVCEYLDHLADGGAVAVSYREDGAFATPG